jgi:two-component system alkaline phosphatase synthesis response regulator PhoP
MEKKKILIVDDEPSVRLLVSSMLGTDHIVIEANDGGEAVDIAQSQKPDLIFMDIMLTAVGYELNKKLAEEVGADGYITKPFDSQELLDTITRFLENTN